jgi:hypothetical protein
VTLYGGKIRFARRRVVERQSFQIEPIGVPRFWWSMIFSEKRFPLFRIML